MLFLVCGPFTVIPE